MATIRGHSMFGAKNGRRYLKQARLWHSRFPGPLSLVRLLRWYPGWVRSRRRGHSPLEDRQPWMTFAAGEFLDRILWPEATVFEWGTGGSTLFFAERAGHDTSVEHDAEWFEVVRDHVEACGFEHWTGNLVPPLPATTTRELDAADPAHFASGSPDYRHCCFRDYVTRIDAYPDSSFDIVLVDGRARPACMAHAFDKVNVGGCLLLDNSDREYYLSKIAVPAGWQRIDLPGPTPYVDFFTQTTAWRRLPETRVHATETTRSEQAA